MWLDRERELASLKRMAATRRAEFLILYGRRRVGKSELPDRFI
ncbi:MAG: ATP-binding protein [Planctomycetes bacterium]|nr:ATP-binding protein [Planctomycetota bacterium]